MPEPDTLIHVDVAPETRQGSHDADLWSLWNIPGRKALIPDGPRLILSSIIGCKVIRVAIGSKLGEGMPYHYQIRGGASAGRCWQAVQDTTALIQAGRSESLGWSGQTIPRPDRVKLAHLRSLQALDASLAGVTHRDIAEVIFGRDQVMERWHPDSELRAQVRHLIRRGRQLMNGGYRRLLGHP